MVILNYRYIIRVCGLRSKYTRKLTTIKCRKAQNPGILRICSAKRRVQKPPGQHIVEVTQITLCVVIVHERLETGMNGVRGGEAIAALGAEDGAVVHLTESTHGEHVHVAPVVPATPDQERAVRLAPQQSLGAIPVAALQQPEVVVFGEPRAVAAGRAAVVAVQQLLQLRLAEAAPLQVSLQVTDVLQQLALLLVGSAQIPLSGAQRTHPVMQLTVQVLLQHAQMIRLPLQMTPVILHPAGPTGRGVSGLIGTLTAPETNIRPEERNISN